MLIVIVFIAIVFLTIQTESNIRIIHYPQENKIPDTTIIWDEQRKLEYSDFHGMRDSHSPKDSVAGSNIGFWLPQFIDIQIIDDGICQYTIQNYTVFAKFDKSLSWVDLEGIKQTNTFVETLNHEQRHFDIQEIYSRILKEMIHAEFGDTKFQCPNSDTKNFDNTIIDEVLSKTKQIESIVSIELQKAQSNYEKEAGFFELNEGQKIWDKKIDMCLDMKLNEVHNCLHLYEL